MSAYHLKYDHYNQKLTDGLQTLYATSDISDITLAVEGKFFRAHQVILSIFSPYFRELFCHDPSKHTIFFMKNVKHRIMGNLLAYMYEGTVRIPADDMKMFIETANELKIKGLTEEPDGALGSSINTSGTVIQPIVNDMPEVEIRKLKRDPPPMQECTIEKRPKTSNNHLLVPKKEAEVVPAAEEITCMVDVGPTEIHCPDDEFADGDEFDDTYMEGDVDDEQNMGHMQTSDENSSVLENILASQPIISGEPVTVTLCKSEKKQKINAIIVDNERYGRLDNSPWTRWTTWLCTATNHKCKRRIILTEDDRIIIINEHNHVKRRSRNLGTINSTRVYFTLSKEDWTITKKEIVQQNH